MSPIVRKSLFGARLAVMSVISALAFAISTRYECEPLGLTSWTVSICFPTPLASVGTNAAAGGISGPHLVMCFFVVLTGPRLRCTSFRADGACSSDKPI